MSEFNESNVLEIAEMLKTATENVEKVYDSGYDEGMEAGKAFWGYSEGYDAGKKAEYDAFWDDYQDNGNRTNYSSAFAGPGWGKNRLCPKYDIIPTNAYMLFYQNPTVFDFVEWLESLGLVADFSSSRDFSYTFGACGITRVGTIDTRTAGRMNGTFTGSANLKTIDKIILRDTGETVFISGTFNGLTALENITFEGVIGQDLDFQWSTRLTWTSIESIVNHLSDTTTGKTLTLSKTAVDESFTFWFDSGDPDTSYPIPGSDENNPYWPSLRDSKPNWTITLV